MVYSEGFQDYLKSYLVAPPLLDHDFMQQFCYSLEQCILYRLYSDYSLAIGFQFPDALDAEATDMAHMNSEAV